MMTDMAKNVAHNLCGILLLLLASLVLMTGAQVRADEGRRFPPVDRLSACPCSVEPFHTPSAST
jgi:hypothetical protein